VADDLIKRYDETFENKAEYQHFIEGKLGLWKNTMELKYFDGLYNEHRNLSRSIKTLRAQAMKLLEEANYLQDRHYIVQQEICRPSPERI
jgi:hypothetical protein